MRETIAASRCPDCGWVVAPPVRICPRHPVEMAPVEISGYGAVLSYTTLTAAPAGFKPPLHIAVVELQGGARIFCHGKETRALRIGRRVAIEQVDGVFYFASLGIADRLSMFWKRRGAAPERTREAVKSAVKRFFNVYMNGETAPSAENGNGTSATGEESNRPSVERR